MATHFSGTVIATKFSAGTIAGNISDTAFGSITINTAAITSASIVTVTSFTKMTGGQIVNLDQSGAALTVDGTGAAFKLGATTLTASDSALLGGITVAAATINGAVSSASGGLTALVAQVTANGTASGIDGAITVARTTAGVYRVTASPTLAAIPIVMVQTTEAAAFDVTAKSATGATINTYTVNSTAAADKAFDVVLILG